MTGLIDHVASFVRYLKEPNDQGSIALVEMRESLLSSSSELLAILESSPAQQSEVDG
jgi:hypothetical protein